MKTTQNKLVHHCGLWEVNLLMWPFVYFNKSTVFMSCIEDVSLHIVKNKMSQSHKSKLGSQT